MTGKSALLLVVLGISGCEKPAPHTYRSLDLNMACGPNGTRDQCEALVRETSTDATQCRAERSGADATECYQLTRRRDEVVAAFRALEKRNDTRKRLGLTDADPSIEDIRTKFPEISFSAPDEEFVAAYHERKQQRTAQAAKVKRDADARSETCAATKAVGFPVGTFGGDRTRIGGAAGGDCETASWLSLHVAADSGGCITWHAMSRDELTCKSGRSVPTMCVERGTASAEKSGSAFALATTVESKGSGGARARYHVWRCGEKRVRTDMKVDLRPTCVALGSDANPTEERVGDVVCQHVRLFDDGGTVSVENDGLRVTLKSGEVLRLGRVDVTE